MRISDFMTEPTKGIVGTLPRPWFSYRAFRREEAKQKYRNMKRAHKRVLPPWKRLEGEDA